MDKSWWYAGTCDFTTESSDYCSYNYGKYSIKYHTSGRFENDCICNNFGDCFILLDGVVFNKLQLMQETETWGEAVYRLLRESPFPETLRGSFSGVIIYQNGELFAFTDHCGEKPVFYYNKNSIIAVATDLHIFRLMAGERLVNLSANRDSLKYLLSYGFMIPIT